MPFASSQQKTSDLEALLLGGCELLKAWLTQAAEGSPLPPLSILPQIEPQQTGMDSESLLADLRVVMEGAYNPSHPGALAHLDPPPLTASIVAELICAGLNNNLLAEELSPSLSHLERNFCQWFAQQLGLPLGSGGVAASGGSLSNLMALVTARNQCGLQGCTKAVVICSADAHVSLGKAMAVMGLPQEGLVQVSVDSEGRINLHLLEEILLSLYQKSIPVIAVVATAGTTVRGVVDPLLPMAKLCHRYGHWLHVDGAIGAVFGLCSAQQHRVHGLGLADSLTVNPQKLLGITKTSSLLLLAEPEHLRNTFSTGLPYMEASWGGFHGGEAGLQGSRTGEILKLWLGLRQLGLDGVEALVEAAIQRRRLLHALLAEDDRLLIQGGDLHLLAFRPKCADAAAAEHWSIRTRQKLLCEHFMLSRPRYQAHHHLKAVLGNPYTQSHHLELLAKLIHCSLDSLPHA